MSVEPSWYDHNLYNLSHVAHESSSFPRDDDMSYNYYQNRRPCHNVSIPNGYGAVPASTQSYQDKAYPTSHGAPHQGHRTTAAYPPLASYAPVHTISNGGNVQRSSATHRSSSRNEPNTALVPHNPTVATRNRATSNARNDPHTQARNPSSTLVPYTGQPSTASNGQNSIPFPRLGAPRNQASTQVPYTAQPNPSTTAPRQRARAASNASSSSCSTCSSTSSSSGARSSTDVVDVRADGVNFHFYYHRR
ncbi:hypothetical protein ARMSODRAFT_1089533 [Armillaria solidipes]|uniref:Uncharacterized protein n=1 Tax=Armillaria solidipes TaxID=1076256 RepID=A0A2H3ASH1_9AGAR|nr:hypothetical protein ARMSODRAFT_1089533 [Armillaria solidipes]